MLLVTPIRHLPTEILREVYTFARRGINRQNDRCSYAENGTMWLKEFLS
jgi:hypothetical protein